MILEMDFGDLSNLRNISPLKEFDLDGIIISIRLFYNSVDNGIYMNIYDESDIAISNGIKLIPNVDFIEKIAYKFNKKFSIYVTATSDNNLYKDVTLENIGKEMVIWYETENV